MIKRKSLFFTKNFIYWIPRCCGCIILCFWLCIFIDFNEINNRNYVVSRISTRLTTNTNKFRILTINIAFFFKLSNDTNFRVLVIVYMSTRVGKTTLKCSFQSCNQHNFITLLAFTQYNSISSNSRQLDRYLSAMRV